MYRLCFYARNVGKDINCYLSINCIFQSPNVPQSYLGELMKPLVLIRPLVHADQVGHNSMLCSFLSKQIPLRQVDLL